MNIALGNDHRGNILKKSIAEFLASRGYTTFDFGYNGDGKVDYPDYATRVAEAVLGKKADYGILICGSGIGMSITANKYAGIRAALCCNVEMARRARMHNDANILCLGADILDIPSALEITYTFINTYFEGGRHQNRLDKISKIEARLLDNK